MKEHNFRNKRFTCMYMYMLRSIQVDEHKLHVYRHMYNVNVSMYIGNYTNVHVPVHV